MNRSEEYVLRYIIFKISYRGDLHVDTDTNDCRNNIITLLDIFLKIRYYEIP